MDIIKFWKQDKEKIKEQLYKLSELRDKDEESFIFYSHIDEFIEDIPDSDERIYKRESAK